MSRRFVQHRRVHLGDCSPSGRMRIDAVLRTMQDIADDDVADLGGVDALGWVVRRTVLDVRSFPAYQESLEVVTWCSGIGGRWAERSTRLTGNRGGEVDAATIWVHVDPATLAPARLPDRFLEAYADAAQGRTVSARLTLSGPPQHANTRQWPLRFADFDVLGHVNNAAAAEAVEQELTERRDLRAPLKLELEYRRELPRGNTATLRVAGTADDLGVWFCAEGGDVLQSARVARWTDA